jgi:predicted enzyme related to lactoylglutathione lyase
LPHGKICYLEIPALDIDASARFYSGVFGWQTRLRGDGSLAFDDTTGAVSGAWVLGRAPAREAGLLTYVMVDSIARALDQVIAAGGSIVAPMTPLSPGGDAFATFRDPAGNLVGLYQERRS